MTIKLVIGGLTLNICSAYMPQVGLDEEEKRIFWEVLDEVVRGVPRSEKIFIGWDFNGNIGASPIGYGDVYGGFGFGDRNDAGAALLNFVRNFGLVVVNSCFLKKKEHMVTFRCRLVKTQIEFLLLMKGDRTLCKDCKVLSSENLVTQHKLLLIDLVIKKERKRKGRESRPRVRWCGLNPVTALEIGAKLEGMRARKYGGT
ncbi:uncharacterized protein LOC107844516 [Capsicum annuum]|uniref:uncharacterized protein LOC107844516 n=1 Tax=Capsicum annuum TaxID=4072 RepID=UPI001FB0F755|nr:uncharacterized protein LOC107844516 [Capsicum annuum]